MKLLVYLFTGDRIECGSAHAPEISNKVRLYGKFESSTSTIIHNQGSGASVDKGFIEDL